MPSEPPHSDTSPRIYLLPNLLTAGNLACGFTAIVKIFEGMRDSSGGIAHYHAAVLAILGACVFDMLDGRVARIRGQESMFGREFDSIADIVSFGIAPALLVMDIVLDDLSPKLAWIAAFTYLLFGAMRLARFNCLAAEDSKSSSKDFVGFPVPAAAGLIASLTVFILWLNEGDREIGGWRYVLLLLMLVLSLMMMSEYNYPSFKRINWRTRRSIPWVSMAVLVLACAVNFWKFVPFFLFLTYFAYGCVRPWVSRKWRREIEEGGDAFEPEIISEEKDDEESPAA